MNIFYIIQILHEFEKASLNCAYEDLLHFSDPITDAEVRRHALFLQWSFLPFFLVWYFTGWTLTPARVDFKSWG